MAKASRKPGKPEVGGAKRTPSDPERAIDLVAQAVEQLIEVQPGGGTGYLAKPLALLQEARRLLRPTRSK